MTNLEILMKRTKIKFEKRFNFILINEFMAESLIVLRRYLCMDLTGKHYVIMTSLHNYDVIT